jgi:hypothetical protein
MSSSDVIGRRKMPRRAKIQPAEIKWAARETDRQPDSGEGKRGPASGKKVGDTERERERKRVS